MPTARCSRCHALPCFYSPPLQIARSLEARPKKLHYVSPAVRDLLRVDVREQLKIIGAGVKTWERQDDKVRRCGANRAGQHQCVLHAVRQQL